MSTVMDGKQSAEQEILDVLKNLRKRIEESVDIDHKHVIKALMQFEIHGRPYLKISPCVAAKTELLITLGFLTEKISPCVAAKTGLLVTVGFLTEKHASESWHLVARLRNIVKVLRDVLPAEKSLRDTLAEEITYLNSIIEQFNAGELQGDITKYQASLSLLQECETLYKALRPLESFLNSINTYCTNHGGANKKKPGTITAPKTNTPIDAPIEFSTSTASSSATASRSATAPDEDGSASLVMMSISGAQVAVAASPNVLSTTLPNVEREGSKNKLS